MDHKHEPDGLDGQTAVEPDYGGHPLFPRAETETGPDPRKFDLIQIIRFDPDTNAREVCPIIWKGSELRSWHQVIDNYGGQCFYKLQAQCRKTHRYTAGTEILYFGGPPRKPFLQNPPVPPPVQPVNAASVAVAPPPQYYLPAPAAAPAAPAGMGPEFIALMRVMLESNANVQTAIMKSLLEQRSQPQGSALEVVREIVPLFERQYQQQPPQQSTLEVVREIVPLIKGNGDSNKGGGATYERGVERGLEIARSLGGGAPQGDDFGEIAKLLTLFKSATGSASPPPPPPSAPAPQPAAYGYPMGHAAPSWPVAPPMSWDGWEMVQTPMGPMWRQVPHAPVQPMPAPTHYAPQPAVPTQYAPAPAQSTPVQAAPQPAPLQQYAPVQAPQPPPVQSEPANVPTVQTIAPVQIAPTPVAPELSVQVPLISNPTPLPIQPTIVPLRQPVSQPVTQNGSSHPPMTETHPVTELVSTRRTPRGVAPYLTAAGLVPAPSDHPIRGAPDDPLAMALGNGAALLRDPAFMEKAAAFMAGDMSPDQLGELLALAEKAGAK